MPTRVESLVWTKPERNRLDKMWLDFGMGSLTAEWGSLTPERRSYISAHILGHEILVEGDAFTLFST